MTTTTEIRKVVRPGRHADGQLFVTIKYTDGRLSITGVTGPKSNGDATGSCGQNRDDLTNLRELAPGWDTDMLWRLAEIWDLWHLNDMQAGTPEQMAHLRNLVFPGYPTSHYEWASDQLANAGLNPHNGYKYGSAWLRVDVPADVLDFLAQLPESDLRYPWRDL